MLKKIMLAITAITLSNHIHAAVDAADPAAPIKWSQDEKYEYTATPMDDGVYGIKGSLGAGTIWGICNDRNPVPSQDETFLCLLSKTELGGEGAITIENLVFSSGNTHKLAQTFMLLGSLSVSHRNFLIKLPDDFPRDAGIVLRRDLELVEVETLSTPEVKTFKVTNFEMFDRASKYTNAINLRL